MSGGGDRPILQSRGAESTYSHWDRPRFPETSQWGSWGKLSWARMLKLNDRAGDFASGKEMCQGPAA